jgi:dethiobiotin synthetase
MSVLIVTGTGTGVGKTVVTAALAALAREHGSRVAVVKPAQTGVTGSEPGDLDEIRRLTGVTDLHELARFPDPLSPEAAARAAGLPPLDLREAAGHIGELARTRDLVLVEGAGGLLVRYDPAGTTIAGLAMLLGARVLVVTEPGLGTLNHTALTLEALAARGLAAAGVVIGCWPAEPGLAEPGLAERSNLTDLASVIGGPVSGALPSGCPLATPPEFALMADAGLAPAFGGRFDPARFVEAAGRPPARANGSPDRASGRR